MKTKEIIICLLALMLLAFTISTVHATDGRLNVNDLLNGTTNNTIDNTPIEQIPSANNTIIPVTNSNTNTNITPIAPVNSSKDNSSTELPSTGIDYSVVLIIAICSVSALYAYKKIKDYNIK